MSMMSPVSSVHVTNTLIPPDLTLVFLGFVVPGAHHACRHGLLQSWTSF